MTEVHAVEGRRGRADFVRVPERIYDGDPFWVPPLRLERRRHFSPRNPYFQHAKTRFFVAYRDGIPVGRVSAQFDVLRQAAAPAPVGHFGLLEGIDSEALAALLSAAEAWLRAHGAERVEGPYSLSINDEAGLLVDGFGSRPRLLMNYAPPWYRQVIEALGYRKAKDLIAYRLDLTAPLPPQVGHLARQTAMAPGVRERPMDRRRFRQELESVLDIFNDAWSDNWGFVPMTAAEIGYMAVNLKPLIHPNLVRIVEIDGEPAAMIVALPDVNEALAGLGGRLLPFGWARLFWQLKVRGLAAARVPLLGIRKAYRHGFLGSGLAALLVTRLREAGTALGVREVELSWLLEDNRPARRLVEAVGGQPYKRYRLYAKDLA